MQGRTDRTRYDLRIGTTSHWHRMGGAARVAAGATVGHLGDHEE